jgi:hypothetical protein
VYNGTLAAGILSSYFIAISCLCISDQRVLLVQ